MGIRTKSEGIATPATEIALSNAKKDLVQSGLASAGFIIATQMLAETAKELTPAFLNEEPIGQGMEIFGYIIGGLVLVAGIISSSNNYTDHWDESRRY